MIVETRSQIPAAAEARAFLRRLRANRNARTGLVIVTAVIAAALFAPLLAPADPTTVDLGNTWMPPSSDATLGTDAVGRDVLSRILYGARVSLLIAFSVLVITLPVGTLLGMYAAWFGGKVDAWIMRTADVVLGFPELILVILIAAMLGPGKLTVVIALSMVWWPGVARLARALVLALRSELYIDAALMAGTPTHRILLRHLLPNITPPLLVRASVGVGFIMMAEATLSFLGVGVQEPEPSWGGMIRDGLGELYTDPHLAFAGSLALGITLIGFNLLGDGLRDLLDPKERQP